MIETYKIYKEKQQKLHAKILKNISKTDKLRKGYDILGVLKGNEVILSTQEEAAVAFDFNIYEKIEDNKNAVDLYIENSNAEDEVESELLKHMTDANTSLYKVQSVNKEEHTLILEDLFNIKEQVTIIDTELAETCTIDSMIFLRIIKLDKFNISSGMSMVFNANHKDYLLRKIKKNSKKIAIEDEVIKKFISFFQLNREEK